jgi:[acyl-carrier-protein] S-malonyltransferase
MKRERVVVICPGRGSYNSTELAYLKKYRPAMNSFFVSLDEERKKLGEISISDLDNAEKFIRSTHTKGENASTLIYACAMADFYAINQEKYEIVAVCGNSMGWYISLAAASVVNGKNAFKLINTMGSMMKGGLLGGQMIYPVMNEHWQFEQKRMDHLIATLQKINLDSSEDQAYISINLGNSVVIGASESAIKKLLKDLEPVKIGKIEYPFQLANHAAFHTPILRETSEKAFELLSMNVFDKPKIPLIDGRGKIWQPYSSSVEELRNYTLGYQVTETYDFTNSLTVALKEFVPDKLLLLGPGSTLGGSIAQVLINNNWRNISSKETFQSIQSKEPFLISMGREDQRQFTL